eukprot:366516-Chlamydomonas_euryale.AAC.9
MRRVWTRLTRPARRAYRCWARRLPTCAARWCRAWRRPTTGSRTPRWRAGTCYGRRRAPPCIAARLATTTECGRETLNPNPPFSFWLAASHPHSELPPAVVQAQRAAAIVSAAVVAAYCGVLRDGKGTNDESGRNRT